MTDVGAGDPTGAASASPTGSSKAGAGSMSKYRTSCNSSFWSTRPITACTLTSAGASPPRSTCARTVIMLPSDGVTPIPEVSTLITRTRFQAPRTDPFQAASSLAGAKSSASTVREATAAGA